MKNWLLIPSISLLLVFSSFAAAQDGVFSLRSGVSYLSGEYGSTETIEDTYVPLTAVYQTRRLAFRATVPYLRVKDDVSTESGLGDVIAAVTVYDVFYSPSARLALDLTGKLKFATADETKGLGTGEHDISVGADLYKFFNRTSLFTGIAYKVRGDPEFIDLENAWSAYVGGTYRISTLTSGGFSLDYRESSVRGNESIREVSAFLSRRISDNFRVNGYLVHGLSDSTPDWGGGISFSTDF